MRLRVSVQLQSPILRQPQLLRPALEKAVSETALDVERDIKGQMRQPKTGRTYARGAITRRASKTTKGLGLRERTTQKGNRLAIVGQTFHRASAPGEAPAVDTGTLVNSVQAVPDGLHATVGSSAAYAAALEYGMLYSRLSDRRVVSIEPRPAFGPAAERASESFTRRVNDAIAQLI